MRLVHAGRRNEVLYLPDAQQIRAGQDFEVDDELGRRLLTQQSVPVQPFDPNAPVDEGEPNGPADETDTATRAAADQSPQREADTGEAQLTQGDAA